MTVTTDLIMVVIRGLAGTFSEPQSESESYCEFITHATEVRSVQCRRYYREAICRDYCGNLPCLSPALRGKRSQAGNIAPVNLVKSDSGTVIALQRSQG